MRHSLLACATALLIAASARGEDCFILASGPDETLHGTFESFSKEGLVLRRRDAEGALAFRPEAVAAVEFGRSVAVPAPVPGMALVRFNNGDALPGKVVSYSPEKTVLETSAGRLEMPSAFVRSLDFASGGGLGFDLLGKEADWKSPGGGLGGRSVFRIQQGKLVMEGYGGRARQAEQPESFTLVMEADVRDGFYCVFGQDRPTRGEGEGDGYLFRIQGARAWLVGQVRGNNESAASFVLPPSPPGAVRRRLSLALDGVAKIATLTVDGKVVGRAKMIRSPKGKHLMVGSNGGKVTLSRLFLVPGGSGGKAAPHDVLRLANRDRAQGRLVAIGDGKAVFEGEAGRLSIPLARLAAVEFSSKHDKAPSSGEGARILFSDLDGLTLRIDKVEGGRIKGQSHIFGPCEIGLDRVVRIAFQPGKASPPVRDADEGDEGEPQDEGEIFLDIQPGVLRLQGGRGAVRQLE